MEHIHPFYVAIKSVVFIVKVKEDMPFDDQNCFVFLVFNYL